MARPRKDGLPSGELTKDQLSDLKKELDRREENLKEREAIVAERDFLLMDMPEEMSEAEMTKWFDTKRSTILAEMLALATKSTKEETRAKFIMELKNMDLGRPGAQKRDETQGIGVVIMQAGKYGL